MTINLIACVTIFKNKLAIGKSGNLLFNLKDDLKYFKNITKSPHSNINKNVVELNKNVVELNKNVVELNKNVVVMGRKTWFSIPEKHRPLEGRINLILTNDQTLLKSRPVPKNLNISKGTYYFTNIKTFHSIYTKYNPNVFVIGGSAVYNIFLKNYNVENVYLTHVQTENLGNIKFSEDSQPDTFMDHLDYKYKLISYSEKYKGFYKETSPVLGETVLSYRFLKYKLQEEHSQEYKYLDLAKTIITYGKTRSDRTGTGTIGIFGAQLRFDISDGKLPLITTKSVPIKAIIEELLFFCRGETDSKILENKGIRIWNGNTTREFLDNRGLSHYPEGCMGPMYGHSWRHFGAEYSPNFSDTSKCVKGGIGGFDQLSHVEHLLKSDPYSRRIYISNLNPAETSKMCLDMCHTYIQFYVEEVNEEKYLSAYFTMRSSDNLAWCYNICSYTILLKILAMKCNMKPKEIVYNSVDCHIYKNHIEGIVEQLHRTPRPEPMLSLDKSLKTKDWSDMEISDFELIGYFPHPSIKMQMAV